MAKTAKPTYGLTKGRRSRPAMTREPNAATPLATGDAPAGENLEKPNRRGPSFVRRVEKAVVQFKKRSGRGVLVAGGHVVTSARCIGRDGKGGQAMSQEFTAEAVTADGRSLRLAVLAVEPVADIAVLGTLDGRRYPGEAEAFAEFADSTAAVLLFRGGMKPHGIHTEFGPATHSVPVHILNDDRRWVRGTAGVTSCGSPTCFFDAKEFIREGAYGGPIVTNRGQLVGVVSTSTPADGTGDERRCEGHGALPLNALPACLADDIADADDWLAALWKGKSHETVKVRCPFDDGKTVKIDAKLAPLIRQIWRLGIRTNQCCQEARPGLAQIEFATADDAADFLSVAQRDYPPTLETWDEGEGGVLAPRIRLAINFSAADVPFLVQRFAEEARRLRREERRPAAEGQLDARPPLS